MSPFEITLPTDRFEQAILAFARNGILVRRDLVGLSGIVVRVENTTQAKMVALSLADYEVHIDEYPTLAEAIGLYEAEEVEEEEDDASTVDGVFPSLKEADGLAKSRELYPESYRVSDIMEDNGIPCSGVYENMLDALQSYEHGDADLPEGVTIRQYSTIISDLMLVIYSQS